MDLFQRFLSFFFLEDSFSWDPGMGGEIHGKEESKEEKVHGVIGWECMIG